MMLFSPGILAVLINGWIYVKKIRRNGEETRGYIIDHVYYYDKYPTPLIESETAEKEKISGTPYISSSNAFAGDQGDL